MEVTGIILAGGKSSRMGRDKGLLFLNGKPLVEYMIDALNPLVNQIIIIANNDDYKAFGYPVYKDIIKEKGPVGGIYTALSHSTTQKNIIVSCDTPFVSTKLLSYLLEKSENCDVTIAKFKNQLHPLIGVYHQSVLPTFKSHIDNNQLKLMMVNQTINTNFVQLDDLFDDEKYLMNINTPQDLKNVEDDI